MIKDSEELVSAIRIKYRFLSAAAKSLGFQGSKDYQRFRNTVMGYSKDYQIILALLKQFPKLDSKGIWGIDKKSMQKVISKIPAR